MKYLKSFIIFLFIFILLFIINTTLSYFDILKENITTLLNTFSILISTFISSIYIGSKSTKKGYLEGIKLGSIIIFFIIIISTLILKNNISLIYIIAYLLIFIISIIGSIIGINKKKNNISSN